MPASFELSNAASGTVPVLPGGCWSQTAYDLTKGGTSISTSAYGGYSASTDAWGLETPDSGGDSTLSLSGGSLSENGSITAEFGGVTASDDDAVPSVAAAGLMIMDPVNSVYVFVGYTSDGHLTYDYGTTTNWPVRGRRRIHSRFAGCVAAIAAKWTINHCVLQHRQFHVEYVERWFHRLSRHWLFSFIQFNSWCSCH